MNQPTDTVSPPVPGSERDVLLTLFDLGRKVASVIDLEELLPRIPELVARLIPFDAFAVYFYNDKRAELTLAYAVGYPTGAATVHPLAEDGMLARVIATQQPVVVGDVTTEAHYVVVVPEMLSALAVPLVHKARSIGVLNVLSRERDRYSERDVAILRQFAAHVATALVNARLFAQQRLDAEAFETLAEIGREVAAVLDLEELLSHIVHQARRLVDYRTFGILLLNRNDELEMKVGVQYGEKVALPKVRLGE